MGYSARCYFEDSSKGQGGRKGLRRLMVKLVAVETALVGWLGYWLFLVYSDNPTVFGGLASQLAKFPQLSFTTVDITVLVVISILAIFLAFRFERGLKPGIRLERALQMLESLMKRNLMLEAQVAEMKMGRAQFSTEEPIPSAAEPPVGSWEKAFRTPIEAGPSSIPRAVRSPILGSATVGLERETVPQRPPARFETKPPQKVAEFKPPPFDQEKRLGKASSPPEKVAEKEPIPASRGVDPSTWDDSSKHPRESQGTTTPSPTPRKQINTTSEHASRRQPYIPAPAPKAVPSSVILGPGVSPSPSQPRPLARTAPSVKPVASPQSGQSTPQVKLNSGAEKPPEPATLQTPASQETTKSIWSETEQLNPSSNTKQDDTEKSSKASGKAPAPAKKRFPWEDD